MHVHWQKDSPEKEASKLQGLAGKKHIMWSEFSNDDLEQTKHV